MLDMHYTPDETNTESESEKRKLKQSQKKHEQQEQLTINRKFKNSKWAK